MLGGLVWLGTIGACGGNAPPPAQPPLSGQAPAAPPPAPPAPPAPPPADDAHPTSEQLVARMAGFRDEMCKCATKDCADKVTEDMTRWGQALAASGPRDAPVVTDDDTKRMAEVTETMVKCMTAVMNGSARP